MRCRCQLLSVLLICSSSAPLLADVFFLTNGGQISGKLLNPDQSPRVSFHIQTDHGGQFTLANEQVARFELQSELERRYEAVLPRVPDTPAAHWDMAERCKTAGLDKQREFHLQQVLRLDPEHEEARRALGYSHLDGEWMRQEDWMEKQGYVRHRGTWRLPQEIEIAKARDAEEEVTIGWRKKLKTWRGWIIKGRDRATDGQLEISRIRDPLAAVALSEQLGNKKEPRQLKLLYIRVLAELRDPISISAMVQHSLEDADPKIREECRDQLERIGSRQAVDAFIRRLKDPQRTIVNRAAAGLRQLNDPAATLPLIDALITEHKVVTGGRGGIQPVFSNQGGGGLTAGGGPKVEEKEFQNEPVLNALTTMHRGVNFGYRQAAWKQWYTANTTPPKINLRRGN